MNLIITIPGVIITHLEDILTTFLTEFNTIFLQQLMHQNHMILN